VLVKECQDLPSDLFVHLFTSASRKYEHLVAATLDQNQISRRLITRSDRVLHAQAALGD
jgi:hypothetical protein